MWRLAASPGITDRSRRKDLLKRPNLTVSDARVIEPTCFARVLAIIVVSVGASAGQLGPSILGGAAALMLVGAVGFALKGPIQRIPRSFLQLVVGTMLTSFGTFWALEGLGVLWPQSDADIVLLLVFYGLSALSFIGLERRARHQALEVVRT